MTEKNDPSASTVLAIVGLSKSYGETQALSDVSVRFCAGTVHAILGENGCGKSTLVKLLAGIHRQPLGVAYIVLDQELTAKFSAWPDFVSTAPGVAYAYMDDYRRNRADVYTVARDASDLAEKLSMPLTNLEKALAGGPRKRLGKGPFHVLGPVQSWIVITDGGLKVSSRHEVARENGSLVEGLFAAGSNGQGGLLLEGHGHHLGWAFTSGRLAGRNAAFFVRT